MSSLVRICLKAAAQAPRINISRPLSFTQITRGQVSNNEPVPAGLEKYELQAKQVGNDNPFDTYVLKPDAGTGLYKKAPILIPSQDSTRMVGCC